MPKRIPSHRPHKLKDHHMRGSAAKRGYDRTWQKLRAWFLASNPICVHCQQAGILTAAVHVDHIQPINQGGARLDQANLQALCAGCHSRKTMREMRGG
jgi:5-methylcytosine-specific restriction protein A